MMHIVNSTGRPSPLARCGKLIFGWRLAVGLLAVPLAALYIRPLDWSKLPLHLRIVAVSGLVLGLFLRAWSAAHAGDHTRSAVIEAKRLASGGPYSRVRNPIYLGNFILGLGMVALLGDPWLLPLHLATFVALYATIIPAEEQFLTGRFGEDYLEYCQHVPALLPRLTSWKEGSKIPPDWSRARGELRLGVLLVAIYTVLSLAAAGRS